MLRTTKQLRKLFFLLAISVFIGCLLTALSLIRQMTTEAKALQPPSSTNYYVCDCSTDADSDCVSGDDANSGTIGSPWRTYEKARSEFDSLSAGDAIRFCRGGAFDLTVPSSRWVNYNCTAATPCTVGDYIPPWASGDEARPILWRTSSSHGFALEDGGNADHDEGYVFENLDLRCTVCETSGGNGFFLYNDVDDVLIDNVRVDGFGIGIHLGGSNPCSSDPNCNGRNERLTVRNATIINSVTQGHLGGGEGLVIEDSYFENNGSGTMFDHNIYVSNASNMRIAGNELYRSSLNAQGYCGGVSLVAHGVITNFVIENNLVREDVGFVTQGCWGIAVDPGYGSAEQFNNVTIRGNRVVNVGNSAIGVGACVNCLIENNAIIHQQDFNVIAIAAPNRTPGAGDAETTDVVVRNNSILVGSGGTAIRVNREGSGHSILSNAIQYTGSDSNWNCLEADLPAASYNTIDYNVCGYGAGEWANGVGNLSVWQILGWGTSSQAADPGFTSSSDLSPISESASIVDAGHPTLSAPNDINGDPRDLVPDAGAYEFRPMLWLQGTPGNQSIRLNWSVNTTLPVTSTWHIDYYTQTVTAPFSVTNIISPTRVHTLTNYIINDQQYTVTLYAILDEIPWLSDTVRVTPTDIKQVYLPIVLK